MEWKQPPARTHRSWANIIKELDQNPGQWAFIGRMSYSAGYVQAKKYGLAIRIANRDGSKADVYLSRGEVK